MRPSSVIGAVPEGWNRSPAYCVTQNQNCGLLQPVGAQMTAGWGRARWQRSARVEVNTCAIVIDVWAAPHDDSCSDTYTPGAAQDAAVVRRADARQPGRLTAPMLARGEASSVVEALARGVGVLHEQGRVLEAGVVLVDGSVHRPVVLRCGGSHCGMAGI